LKISGGSLELFVELLEFLLGSFATPSRLLRELFCLGLFCFVLLSQLFLTQCHTVISPSLCLVLDISFLFINLYRCTCLAKLRINENLTLVDFTTSYNYSIDPGINKIYKAKFSFPGVMGLLDKYDIIVK